MTLNVVGYRDSSIGKSSVFYSGDPGSNPGGGLTPFNPIRRERITSCKSHIAPVSLTDWHIMI